MSEFNCIRTGMTRPPTAIIASGFNSTRFAALVLTKSISSVVQRSSNSMLLPRVHPSLCNSCRNAPARDCHSGSLGGNINTPMRRIRAACCARAANGHVAAAPISVMKSRLFN